MKRNSTGENKKGGIKWDEDNLTLNEQIKKELNPTKIDEPPTPFAHRSPMETDEDDEEQEDLKMSPLSINESAEGSSKAERKTRVVKKCAWSDSDTNGTGSSPLRVSRGQSPRFNEEYIKDHDAEEDSDDPEKLERKRRFREARKSHYHMEFMKQANEQLAQLADEEEDDDNDDAVNGKGGPLADEDNGEQEEAPKRGFSMSLPDKSIL